MPLVTAIALGILLNPQLAAEEEEIRYYPAAAPPGAPLRAVLVEIEEEAGNQVQGNDGHQFELTEETLDQWVFNGSPDVARQNYQTLLKLEIEQIDAACDLSPDQKQLLELAGEGELQRMRQELTVLHARYAGRTYDQDKLGEIFQEIQPLQAKFQRAPLAPTSLLYKLLWTTLDDPQVERFVAWEGDRHRVRLRGQIAAAVATIERQVPLRSSQREALVRLLEAEIRPVAPAPADQNQGVRVPEIVLPQMNAIPEEAFQAFLDVAQWESMQQAFLPYRGQLRMLQQEGLLLENLEPTADSDTTSNDAEEPS